MSVKLTKKQLTTSILDELKKEDGLNSDIRNLNAGTIQLYSL